MSRFFSRQSTVYLNWLLAGRNEGETTSSAVGRKSLEGRWFFRVWAFAIDLLFLVFCGEHQHCIRNIDWHLLDDAQKLRALRFVPRDYQIWASVIFAGDAR